MRQLRLVTLVLAFSLAATQLGCLTYSHKEHDVDRTPVVTTGAGATILYPGRSVQMPPPVHPSKLGAPVQAPAGGAYPGGSAQAPYPYSQAPQPSYSQPAPYGQPAPSSYPQAQPGGAGSPQSGAYPPSGAPGYGSPAYATPETARPAASGSGGGMTMLGGTTVEEDTHTRVDEEPLYVKYLMLPFAVAAAPFKYAYEKARGEHQPGPPVPTLEHGAPPPAPSAAPQDYESRRLEQMERELSQRAPAPPAPEAARPAVQAPPMAQPATRAPAQSLADELAMLRQPAPAQASRAPAGFPPAPQERSAAPSEAPAVEATAPAPARAPSSAVAGASGEVDRNGDGRTDQWIFRKDGDLSREVFDEDFDGRPDRTLIYDPASHEVTAIEEDADHDGRLDTWTTLQGGAVTRRRVDDNGDGQVDTWETYRDGQLARIERDTDGDGFRDRISFYENGRLASEQEDDDGDGRPEATRYYDAAEKITRVEEDANGDGKVDVVSHYDAGRLTSREILDTSVLSSGSGKL